jgi:hypothetical protein
MGNDLSAAKVCLCLVACLSIENGKKKRELTVFVNGKQRHVAVDPSTSLATWLRMRFPISL